VVRYWLQASGDPASAEQASLALRLSLAERE
jgi:hypothetical protein